MQECLPDSFARFEIEHRYLGMKLTAQLSKPTLPRAKWKGLECGLGSGPGGGIPVGKCLRVGIEGKLDEDRPIVGHPPRVLDGLHRIASLLFLLLGRWTVCLERDDMIAAGRRLTKGPFDTMDALRLAEFELREAIFPLDLPPGLQGVS